MIKELKKKYNLSFLDKLKDEPGIEVFVFGGSIRDIKLNRSWKEIDLRIVYDKPRKERESKIEELLKEHNLEGKTRIDNLNLTVYRFLPKGSHTNEPIDLSLVPAFSDNIPDFTVNAIFYDLKKEKILDTYSGLEDLEKKIIRTVKKPDIQFKEEPHMIFRALKFACQLDFEIEEITFQEIKKNKSEVQNTFNFILNEKEGIFVELFLGNIFKGLQANPKKYFEYLNQTGLFEEFVNFYSKESELEVKEIDKVNIEDLGSYEKNISYLLSSIVNSLKTDDKDRHFNLLAEKLAISTPKIYSDFVVGSEDIKYLN